MDDSRTHETLNALADLFLTRGAAAAPAPQAPVAAPARSGNPLASAAGGPIRMAPKPAGGFQARPRALTSDAQRLALSQALAESDRYSARGPAPAAAAPAPDAPPRPAPGAEVVFLGSLPGFAAPWLNQYAQHLAQERGGSVLIVHADGPAAELRLVSAAPDPAAAAAAATDLAAPTPGLRLVSDEAELPESEPAAATSLVGAVRHLTRHPDAALAAVLVHVADPASPEGLRLTVSIPHWTILCGADEAALAAAERQVRALFDAAAAAGPEPSAVPGSVHVMVMGSDEAASKLAAGKLSAAVAGFLQMPVGLRGYRKQMTPVNIRPVGRFMPDPEAERPFGGQLLDLLEQMGIADPGAGNAIAQAPVRTAPVAPRASAAPPPAPSAPPDSPAPLAEPIPQPEPLAATPAPARPAASPASSAAEPDLASFLTEPAECYRGAVALQARCPRHPQTQLLLDRRGRLHLLRRHERPEANAPDSLRAAILDLVEARAWVHEHLELLRLSQPQCRFDPVAKPLLHLFTDDAKTAAALVARLGKFVRLHLLQQARCGDATSWVCADLN